ncbi:hypothetical protein I6N96_13390 [Enterococcus sp. BWM-S5]|uniref:Uncharacterized protein n=1 Tax=Enterococcus larvae TaxID=2794352 RepID=A0ABS4CL40_9ENTE|nr:hypothetical protein [Enterococcus larvae]MBP1047271.1 hypothetical protein [Enterococcus larvae]
MAKNFPIQQKDIERLENATVQLFNKSFWQLYHQQARRFIYLVEDGERHKQEIGQLTATKQIYSEIKLLMDNKGNIIGKRMDRSSLLLSTNGNRLKQAPRPKKYELSEHERSLASIEGQEYKDWLQEMKLYCHEHL